MAIENVFVWIIINHLGAVDEHGSTEAQHPGLLSPRPLQPTAPHVLGDDAVVAQPQRERARRSPATALAAACPLGS